jgi:predicted N-acetyltransferase YhbS
MKTTHPRTTKEKRELAEMAARAFTGNYDRVTRSFMADMTKNPSVRSDRLRTIRKGRRLAAHVGIHRKTLRIGRTSLDMGGLAMVCCDPEFRGTGLASTCIEDTVSLMRTDGMDVSMLFGIDRFYTRFGFVGCLPTYTFTTRVGELAGLKNRLAVTPYANRDLDELLALYAAASARTPGAIERTRASLAFSIDVRQLAAQKNAQKTARKGANKSAMPESPIHVFREKSKSRRARAYVIWLDGGSLEIAMAPGDGDACEAVLAWLRDRRIGALEKEVDLSSLCPAHPLWQYALRFNHTAETRFSWTGGGMGLILDVDSFLEKMQQEFESRIDASGIVAECHLHLKVDGVEHNLILCRSHHFTNAAGNVMAASVACSKQSLLQMCLGTFAPESLPDVKVSGMDALVKAVFPASTPTVYRLDYF